MTRRARGLLALVLCLMVAAVPGAAQSDRADPARETPAGQAPAEVAGGGVEAADAADANDSGDPDTPAGLGSLGILAGRPTIRPTRLQSRPTIDGRLDDDVWQTAATITELVQQRPLDGAPATEATEIYLGYDNENLYFGFYLHYSDPSIMRANRVDRDRAREDDLMTVYFDTFLDQQRSYSFDVNAYGVQGDGIINLGGRGGGGGIPPPDRSWDTLFDTAAQIVADGYTAEMAIPFKSLRYPPRPRGTPHRWGFQIVREMKGKDEENVVWAPMSRDVAGFMTQMGVLEGMTNLSTSRKIEILPTFTAIQFGSLDDTNTDFVNLDTEPEGGVNAKYGVTSNLTADFTLNPDFSQIESDRPQIEVNRRFPLFFAELRPFFVEGAELFDVPGPVTFVHTRTIVDPLYGAKLTGKVGRTSVGLLAANDEARGNVDDPTDPLFGKSAQTFIGRVKHDLYAESHVGAIVTNREFQDSHSRLVGFDGNFRLSPSRSMSFRAVGTRHRDLNGVERDGHVLDAGIRENGRNLGWSVSAFQISPDFETDVGFVRRTDQRRTSGNISYRWWPESWIINWGPRFNYARNWNYDDILEDEDASLGLNVSLTGNIRFNANVSRDMERFGGIDFFKNGYSFGGGASTSRALQVSGNFSQGDQILFDATNPFLGRGTRAGFSVTIRPVSRLRTQINVNTSRLTDPRNGDAEVFDVKIFRAFSTYQFSDRLLLRNISEYDTFNGALDLNLLFTYRVNAGTVFFFGYDDHYQQEDKIDDTLFFSSDFRRTNRAVFTKLQYLFRY